MTRKTLSKLGLAMSVAAFTTGAWAADAVEVAAEAEPMDYVRICDTYGAGFYYIPGTETCLKVGGFVRYQIGFGNEYHIGAGAVDGAFALPAVGMIPFSASDYGWSKSTTVSVKLDARSETEMGTLRGFLDVRASNGGAAAIDSAFIELGGLLMGKSGNAYDYDIGGEQDMLGGANVNHIQYTFAGGNGFSAAVSIDDDGDVTSGAGAFGAAGADFVPNVSANVQYSSGPLAVGLYGAYDNNTDEGAVKGIASYSLSDNDKLSLAAYWAGGPTYVHGGQDLASTPFRNSLSMWGEWSVQGAYWHRFSDKLSASLGAVYISNFQRFDDVRPGTDINFLRVGATVDYALVPGFNIKTNLNYNKFSGDTVDLADSVAPFFGGDEASEGYVSGFVRFQRDF